MKKVLSLAFIAAVLLFGCSADGFFSESSERVTWGKVCKTAGGGCREVQSKSECDGVLILRSECN